MAHRTVRSDGTIIMGKPYANDATIVELHRPSQSPVRVPASTLNALHAAQQAAYGAEASLVNGLWIGPTGQIRTTNKIRVVDVSTLLVPTQSTGKLRSAA